MKSRWPRTAASCEVTASSERPLEVAGEDHVDDVLRARLRVGRDRVDDRHRPLDGQLVVDADLLRRARAGARRRAISPDVDPAARAAASTPSRASRAGRAGCGVPAEDGRDADARLGAHHTREEPNPRAPRSLAGQLGRPRPTSRPATATTTSCAIRMPGSTTNGSLAVGVEQHDAHLAAVAGVDEPGRVHDRDPVARGQAGARLHEAGIASGMATARPVRRRLARPGRAHALAGGEVEAGVARVGPRRQHGVLAQPPHRQLDHEPSLRGVAAPPRRRGRARSGGARVRGSRARTNTPSGGRPAPRSARRARRGGRALRRRSYGTSRWTGSNRSAKRSAMRARSSSRPSPGPRRDLQRSGNRYASRRRAERVDGVDLVQDELDAAARPRRSRRGRPRPRRPSRRAARRSRTRRRRGGRGRRRASPRASTRSPRRAGAAAGG